MNLIFLGPPGAGKGTQAQIAQRKFGLIQLSTGEMLREAVAKNTDLGQKARSIMDRGELVPDDIMVNMIRERIILPDCKNGFILDGFPRTIAQAESLDFMLDQESAPLKAVIQITVDEEALIQRVEGRFSCAECGEGYHDRFKLTQQEGICDICGSSQFKRRPDDNRKTMTKRLLAYNQQTAPLIPYYEKRGILKSVDGMLDIYDVTKEIATLLTSLNR